MQRGRTPGKRFIPKRFIDYFDAPYPKQVLVSKALAQSDQGLTIQGIVRKTDVSRAAVRNTIAEMYNFRFIHISHWVKINESGYVAAYSVGLKEDVEKPMSERAIKESRKRQEKALAHNAQPDTKLVTYYKSLANALAPKRKPDEQRKVNNLYLNWISGGQYERS